MAAAKHPAPFSSELIEPMAEMLEKWSIFAWSVKIYDPMAGSGERLAYLAKRLGVDYCGCEIEPEFIADDHIMARDCTSYIGLHAVTVTSPAYGNRLADQYLGTPNELLVRAVTGKVPRRRSYAIALGRKCHTDSGARLQWGGEYQAVHERIFAHVVRANMIDGGVLLLNVASHFRAEHYTPVAEWYLQMMHRLGVSLVDYRFVETRGYRDGDNRELRVGGEHLMLWRKG